jgi:hypothetical protein
MPVFDAAPCRQLHDSAAVEVENEQPDAAARVIVAVSFIESRRRQFCLSWQALK